MALVNPYCSVAAVQEELHNKDNEKIPWLEDCINQASRFVDEWRGRDYYQHDHSSAALIIRSAIDSCVEETVIRLPYWPIIELTEVKEANTVLVLGTDYIIARSGNDIVQDMLVRVGRDWALGVIDSESVQLTGKFGYAQATSAAVPTGIPAHVSKATCLLAAAFSTMNQKEIISADGLRDRIATTSIPPQVATLLGPKAWRFMV